MTQLALAGGGSLAAATLGGRQGVSGWAWESAARREFSAVILPGLIECLVPFYFANQGISPQELERS